MRWASLTPDKPFRYILAVSTLEPRKNFTSVVRAWERIRYQHDPDLKLIIVGRPGWRFEPTLAAMRPRILEGSLLHLQDVSSVELQALYAQAECLVSPSYSEGFGFPPLEAMQWGTPAIVSDIPAHRWAMGDAVLYVDPYSVPDIAKKIAQIVVADDRETLRRELRAKAVRQLARYAPEAVGDQWAELFARLKRGEGPASALTSPSGTQTVETTKSEQQQSNGSCLVGLLKKLTGPAGAAGPESLHRGGVAETTPFATTCGTFPDPQMMMREGLLTDLSVFELEPCRRYTASTVTPADFDHFVSPRYRYWCKQFKETQLRVFIESSGSGSYICAALHERGMLDRVSVVWDSALAGNRWLISLPLSERRLLRLIRRQKSLLLAGGRRRASTAAISISCGNERSRRLQKTLTRRVSFRAVDMNTIAADLTDFDFCWSSCCFEHLGSIDHGLQFIHNTMRR